MNYCVAFTQRSGSSHLCALLRSAAIGRPYEVFEIGADGQPKADSSRQGPGEWDSSTWRSHYASYLACNAVRGISGCKITREQWRNLCAQLHRQPAVDAWIWLRRRDVLRQAISLYRAQETNQWDLTGERPAKAPPRFDPMRILTLAQELVDADASWQGWFEHQNLSPLTIFYEEFSSDRLSGVWRIADRLGVGIESELASEHRIQADEVSEVWFDELAPAWRDINPRSLK
jgi:LPS sulfotransferase NodH